MKLKNYGPNVCNKCNTYYQVGVWGRLEPIGAGVDHLPDKLVDEQPVQLNLVQFVGHGAHKPRQAGLFDVCLVDERAKDLHHNSTPDRKII